MALLGCSKVSSETFATMLLHNCTLRPSVCRSHSGAKCFPHDNSQLHGYLAVSDCLPIAQGERHCSAMVFLLEHVWVLDFNVGNWMLVEKELDEAKAASIVFCLPQRHCLSKNEKSIFSILFFAEQKWANYSAASDIRKLGSDTDLGLWWNNSKNVIVFASLHGCHHHCQV